MTAFKSVAMVRHPVEEVWKTLRDDLPSVVPYLDDVASITQEDRAEHPDGTVRLVNRWKASTAIPAAVKGVIKPEMLTWLDRAEWDPKLHVCSYKIETAFFADRVRCAGTSRYEPAMGGRGTRVTFEGEIHLSAKGLPGVPGFLEGTVAKGVEAFVAALIPNNLRKVVEGVGEYLERGATT